MVKIMFVCEKLQKKWSAYATCMPRIGESVRATECGHTYKYVVVNVETVICGDISLPEVKTAEYVVYVKPVRHGADAAGASKKEKKESAKANCQSEKSSRFLRENFVPSSEIALQRILFFSMISLVQKNERFR